MDGHVLLQWVTEVIGLALMLLILLDVFLTVLYARIGTGFISHHLACWMWKLFRLIATPFKTYHDAILSFCGPCILVALVGVWIWGLMLGASLVIYPRLGTSVRSASENSPVSTDFITALYIAGDSMTTVGTSDVAPKTGPMRVFYTFTSLVGISMITLTLTYFLEIYNALQERNTFALKVHLASAETGDAAEMLAGIGPEGQFTAGYTHLAEMAAEMATFKEAHHFYSVLFYFRFRDPHYAVSRLALVTLDCVSLIKSALDDREYGWLKESAAVAQLWRGSMHLMAMLAMSFLPQQLPQVNDEQIDAQTQERWRRRFHAGVRRLRQAGIKTIDDEENGAQTYIALRARWDRFISSFAEHMGHDMTNIDPAGTRPESADERQEFRTRLRAAS